MYPNNRNDGLENFDECAFNEIINDSLNDDNESRKRSINQSVADITSQESINLIKNKKIWKRLVILSSSM